VSQQTLILAEAMVVVTAAATAIIVTGSCSPRTITSPSLLAVVTKPRDRHPSAQLPTMHDNTLFLPDTAVTECGMPLPAWQAKGNDLRTTVAWPPPAATELLALAKETLATPA